MSKERLAQIRNELRSLQAQYFSYKQVVYRLEEQIFELKAEHDKLDRSMAETDGRKKIVKLVSQSKKKKEPTEEEVTKRVKSLSQEQVDKLIEELGKL